MSFEQSANRLDTPTDPDTLTEFNRIMTEHSYLGSELFTVYAAEKSGENISLKDLIDKDKGEDIVFEWTETDSKENMGDSERLTNIKYALVVRPRSTK